MSDYYMYSQSRYMTGGSNNPFQNRTQYAFELATSAHYRQFHEMKAEMPSDVLELFKANQINFYRPPIKKTCRALDPVANLKMDLTQMFAIPNLEMEEEEVKESRLERKERIKKERAEKNQNQIKVKLEEWNPFEQENMSMIPQCTLFVGRMNYKTNQKDLKYEFEKYGLIKSVYIVRDKEGNSKGYGFVQFQNKDDFVTAYKGANGRKINGRRVVVDYQRGRSTLRWRPRRFGGGLGDRRLTKEEAKKYEEQQAIKKAQRKLSRSRSRSRNKKQRKQGDEKDRERDRQRERDRENRKKDKKDKKDKKEKKDKKQKQPRID